MCKIIAIANQKGVEYMMKEKGYEVDVNLSDISLRY